MCTKFKNPNAVALGRLGGKVRSAAKLASGRLNCKKAAAAAVLAATKRRTEVMK